MKRIEVHCIDSKGERFIMNRLTGENTGLSNSKLVNKGYREKLIERAQGIAYAWSNLYPDDRFLVVEV